MHFELSLFIVFEEERIDSSPAFSVDSRYHQAASTTVSLGDQSDVRDSGRPDRNDVVAWLRSLPLGRRQGENPGRPRVPQ